MNIILVGLNYESAPVELREKLAFQQKRLGEALISLTRENGRIESQIMEGVIVSTCNRVEIYAVVNNTESGFRRIKDFLSQYHKAAQAEFEHCLYTFSDLEVVEHLFSVVSGIKSMVLGETQIQSQIKQAFEIAQKYKVAGPFLSTLFRNALTVGKRVRCETAISEHSLSVSHAAVSLIRRRFQELSDLNVLVVGLGKISLIAIKTLAKLGVRNLMIVNRTEGSAQDVANELGAKAYGFDRLQDCLAEADVVLSSTSAPHFILTTNIVEKALQARQYQPLFIIDIAVPRDVDPQVARLNSVTLHNIDQLETQIEANLEQRCSEINKVRDIINQEVENFIAWRQSLEVKPVITDLREHADEIRERELQRALRRMEMDLSEHDAQIVQELARRIVNKMLHKPMTRLREEAVEGNGHIYTAAIRDLFGLEEQTSTR